MANLVAAAGVFLLAVFAPFEMTRPILQLPGQAVTNLEALLALGLGSWAVALACARRLPNWRDPVGSAWLVFLGVCALSAAVAPSQQVNAWHMVGRLTAAAAVYLLTVDALATRARLQIAVALAVAAGVVVAALAALEYLQVEPVLRLLRSFRPGVSGVGAQVRASGTLQYPTIASMYLEVVFAFGLGLMVSAADVSKPAALGWLAALLLIGEAIVLTFTRAGLITMAASLLIVGAVRVRQRGFDFGAGLVTGVSLALVTLVATSRSAQSMWLRLTTEGQDSWYRARVQAPSRLDFSASQGQFVTVEVTNTGLARWDSSETPPTLLSYHWLADSGDRVIAFDGERTDFPQTVDPGETVTLPAFVRAPSSPGAYQLEWDVVQEGLLWFSTEQGAPPGTVSRAIVTGSSMAAPLTTRQRPAHAVRPGRRTLWTAALRMAGAHPLFGVGPDNFRLLYGSYSGLASADPRIHSNNMYLEILAGGGVLALTAFAWLIWRNAERFIRMSGAGPIQSAVAAAGAAIAVHGLADSFLSFAPTYILFAMTLGFGAALARSGEPAADAHRV